jgi:hypothetical protein
MGKRHDYVTKIIEFVFFIKFNYPDKIKADELGEQLRHRGLVSRPEVSRPLL